ncbi:nucleolar protein dao-5-like [Hemibagrus wyckioides]|uniref:nucleolar protein dao-5-like n=1 Tax=Hemibagrus wyckioides TaxID=337641 RepID=UPI00266BAB4E|nr:nucleolar protein dao-5-like [Hemibagrus wyckioides]
MANSSSDESEDSTKASIDPCTPTKHDEEDDEEEEEDSDDTESDEDDGEPRTAPERYTPQTTVMDKPCAKQSDPTVLSPWLSENRKQHNVTEVKVKSIESAQKNPKAIDDWIDSISRLHRSKPPATVLYTRPMPDIDTLMQEWPPEFDKLLGKQKKTGPPARPCEPAETDEEDDDDEDDSDDTESDEDYGAPRPAPERYTPQTTVMDKPCAKQSDPTVLSPWLSENRKQHNVTEVKVKSIKSAQKNPKAIDDWIDSISQLHRSKPPATVLYTRPMPDTDTLMQEWPPEFEELLGKLNLPTADIDCDLEEYIDTICGILDIPVYESRIQSLHVLFSLYSEIRNFQVCFNSLAFLCSSQRTFFLLHKTKLALEPTPELIAKPPNNKTLDINDSGEVASLYAPTPWQAVLRNTSQQQLKSMANSSSDESEDSIKQKKTGPPARPCEPAETDEEDDDDEEDDSDDTESDEDYGAPRPAPERYTTQTTVMDKPCAKQSDPTVLSPWLSENRKQHNVTEVKVKSIKSAQKNPKAIDDWIDSISQLHRSKPPATVLYTRPMPDIDTLMQEWPPDFEEHLGKQKKTGPPARPCEPAETDEEDDDDEDDSDDTESDEDYGAPRPAPEGYTPQTTVMDKPCAKQSDPTVLSPWLSENRKQHNVTEVKVKSIKSAQKNPKAIDDWIDSISQLHRSKPPATVLYTRPMPDIDNLMQEWPPDFEELLGKQKKTGPPARPCEPAETDEEDDDDEEDDSDDTESDEDDGDPRPAPEGTKNLAEATLYGQLEHH